MSVLTGAANANACEHGPVTAVLGRAAHGLAHDPGVIASALTTYRIQAGMTEGELARWLQLSVLGLHGLALCTKPAPDTHDYHERVAVIARYVGCDVDWLRIVLDAEHPSAPA